MNIFDYLRIRSRIREFKKNAYKINENGPAIIFGHSYYSDKSIDTYYDNKRNSEVQGKWLLCVGKELRAAGSLEEILQHMPAPKLSDQVYDVTIGLGTLRSIGERRR
ncbi:hypothetical protein HY501_03480 [Candidatus Woesearchaeota archaeon]|nr:hypothetical protein [Candidatus Woesearchaeota archaeon]